MTSNRPYLLRAIFDWICDNSLTVHLLVDAEYPGVEVPTEFVDEGQIVLNITPRAVQQFSMDLEWVMFSARFSGVARRIIVPIDAVKAIFAKENGQGMAFETAETPPEPPTPDPEPDQKGSHLRVVK